MKIRRGFVTNSSSSSFVIAFNSEEDFKEEVELIQKKLEGELEDSEKGFAEELKGDVLKNIVSAKEARKTYEEYLRGWGVYDLLYNDYDYHDFSWTETDEFKEKLEEYVKEHLKEFDEKADGKKFFSLVEYEDHTMTGSLLEHYVLPQAPFTLERMSHH